MKKILVLLSIFVLAFSINVFANTPVKVLLNDEYMDFTDENNQVVNPEITNSRTMVPLRKIFESLDAKVEWDNDTRTVTAQKGARTIKLTIGSEEAYIIENGYTTMYTLDSVAYIKDGRTLVPLRFISESLGCLVGWDQNERTAILISLEDLTQEVLNECTNLKEFITSLKLSDKEYFNIDFSYEGIPNNSPSEKASAKFNIFNNDNNLILNILNVNPDEDGISGNYYDAGSIIDEDEMETTEPSEVIGSFIESDDIQKGTYTSVKNEFIKIFNNDNFTIKTKGNKKTYLLNTKLDIPMEDGNLKLDIKLNLVTVNDILNNINVNVEIVDFGILSFNMDIEYLDKPKQLPSNIDLIPIFELIFG